MNKKQKIESKTLHVLVMDLRRQMKTLYDRLTQSEKYNHELRLEIAKLEGQNALLENALIENRNNR